MSSTTAAAPPAPHFPTLFHNEHDQSESISSKSACHSLPPDPLPANLKSLTLEEEDETSSEAANEPITPIDNQLHPADFTNKLSAKLGSHTNGEIHKQPPLVLNTSATPPPPPSRRDSAATPISSAPVSDSQSTPASTSRRPGSSGEGKVSRVMSGLFSRRTNSGSGNNGMRPDLKSNGSDPMLGQEHRRTATKTMDAGISAVTTRSNTPPSPSSPSEKNAKNRPTHLTVQEPKLSDFFHSTNKKRTATGFSFKDKFSRHKNQDTAKEDNRRLRSTSVDLKNDPQGSVDPQYPVQHISRQPWGMPAETGIGLKSRRLSLSLPDDFDVDVIDLYSEFSDQSKLLGKRGKTVGKGATSNVKLMLKKGGGSGDVFAVKEFRGKSSNETEEEYEKKVKSEYSIAKSAHHPNIVATIRLATHHGRWNHVMEFCDQGDLFSLVSLKYLAAPDHQGDRLCLFKQLIQGLHYLHNHGIAHRDVKLENCLITKDSKLKITDFGVSEVFCGIHPGLRSAGGECGKGMEEARLCAPGMCGSPPYVAPEVVAKKGQYDPRPVDVWGAAVVMLCMCANGQLWDKAEPGSSKTYDDLIRGWDRWNAKHCHDSNSDIIDSDDYPHVSFFNKFINPPALRRLLVNMLNPDPAKRTTMADVANNRWFKNVECCQIDGYDDPSVVIDASKASSCSNRMTKVVLHNHLPPVKHHGHALVRLPGSTEMK